MSPTLTYALSMWQRIIERLTTGSKLLTPAETLLLMTTLADMFGCCRDLEEVRQVSAELRAMITAAQTAQARQNGRLH